VERAGEIVRLAPAKLSVSNEVFVGLMRWARATCVLGMELRVCS